MVRSVQQRNAMKKTSSQESLDSPVRKDEPSLLESMMQFINESTSLQINFEDLTGVARDIPDLRLSPAFRMHMCAFCRVVQPSMPAAHLDCIRNKMAANRLALKKRCQFAGQCHLGVTDTVKPLIYCGRVLGVFYYGSFVLKGTEKIGLQKIKRYCARRHLDPETLVKQFKLLPHIDEQMMKAAGKRLDLICRMALRLVEVSGIPLDRYRTEMGANFLRMHRDMPLLVIQAMDYVHKNYSEAIRVSDIADQTGCNPDYLSRVFKESVGYGLSEYIMRVRIDHARHLLHVPRYSISEIGFLVGFQEHSHFGKVFKRFVGETPSRYREILDIDDHAVPLSEERFTPELSYYKKR